MEYGICFAEACCVFIIKKLIKFNRVVFGQNKSRRVDNFREQRNALIKECVKLVGEEYQQCIQSPTLKDILKQASKKFQIE